MAFYNVHAGHNPDGKVGCGAVGLIKESTEARKVKDEVIRLLQLEGHTVYDCTVEDGTSQSNVLTKIVNKCNAHSVEVDVSIHFNAGANDKTGNGTTTGVEVLVYNSSSKVVSEAERICNKISALGFRNRGVKTRSDLYVLKNTKSPALLVECCFVDDADDVSLYNYESMAKAIVEGILNKSVSSTTSSSSSNDKVLNTAYTYNNVDYRLVFDPTYYSNKYSDLKTAFGTNATKLLQHFVTYGMKEGRQACEWFNVEIYKSNYTDLQKAFGSDLVSYYKHYINYGFNEGRKASNSNVSVSIGTTSSGTSSSNSTLTTPFKVRVTDSALNIRAGAGTSYKVVGCIKDKGTYTITKVSGSWGYLKSGAGWICISTKYVKYV